MIQMCELAWAAGFFDGEGSFSHNASTMSSHLSISQIELEPLFRFQMVLGVGAIYTGAADVYRSRRYPEGRQMYRYHLNGYEAVWRATMLLWPWLSQWRRDQAKKMFDNFHRQPRKKPFMWGRYETRCPRGHLKSESRSPAGIASGIGRCRACYKDWRAKHPASRAKS